MTAEQGSADLKSFVDRRHRLLIDGEWLDAVSGETRDVIDPATGAVIAQVAEGGGEDVEAAVAAARASFDDRRWQRLPVAARTSILMRYADLIEQNGDLLAMIDVADNGMPLFLARAILANATEGLRYAAMLAATMTDKNVSGAMSSAASAVHAYTASSPVGVVGLIIPWNGPAGSFLVKVAPALAAGCSCIVKPAENTPLAALLLGQLAMEAGVPPGVLNIVTGAGNVAGQALVEHVLVDKISFTGSTQVGKRIAQLAAGNLKRVTLELGGKSPSIVFDDADLSRAIPSVAMGIFINSGQLCVAGSRLFVQRKVYDRVVAGVSEVARSLKLGNGFAADTQLGPVISSAQRERIMAFVDESRRDGADIVAGGGSPELPGYFVEPTVVANVDRDMRIVREEVFGPVVVATPFDSVEDVITQANDTRFGLAAGVFTEDVNKAHRVTEALQAGNIWVNCYGVTHPLLPFGGFKESGWGREFGIEGIEAYREKKSVVVQLA